MRMCSLICAAVLIAPLVAGAAQVNRANKYARARSERPIAEAATAAATRPAAINDVYVIHFVIDGTNRTAFEKALASGALPTIRERFVEKGAIFDGAVSNFPSTSPTIYQAYTTGLLPGHAGIPHLERFDRQRREVIGYLTPAGFESVNSDLINRRALENPAVADLDATNTIFELLAGYPTAAVYTNIRRGATIRHPERAPIRALWNTFVAENIPAVDRLAFDKIFDLFEEPVGEIPRYTLVGLYSSDIAGHHDGPHSDAVAAVLTQFDLFLKEFFALLERRGLAEKTFVIVSADHGMHATGELFRLQQALEKRGVRVKPSDPRVQDYTIYAANRGVVSSHLYIKHDGGPARHASSARRAEAGGFAPLTDAEVLRHHPTRTRGPIDLIEAIRSLPATDLLVVRDGERRVRLFGRDGREATISCATLDAQEYCRYRFDPARGDPLRYADNPKLAPLLDGRAHHSRDWLAATIDERYPDAVIQLSQIFRDGRAGDCFVTARAPYGFRKVKRGNHGGAQQEDMRVPLLIAGPGVPVGRHGAIRPADLYPLLLEWFGLHVPAENYDGKHPFRDARRDPAWASLASVELVLREHPPLRKMIGVPDFVSAEIMPIAPAHRFPHLLTLARRELGRRADAVRAIRGYIERLERQGDKDDAPRVVAPEYSADHLAIARRALDDAEAGLLAMEEAIAIFSKCRNVNSASCRKM